MLTLCFFWANSYESQLEEIVDFDEDLIAYLQLKVQNYFIKDGMEENEKFCIAMILGLKHRTNLQSRISFARLFQ